MNVLERASEYSSVFFFPFTQSGWQLTSHMVERHSIVPGAHLLLCKYFGPFELLSYLQEEVIASSASNGLLKLSERGYS